MTAFLLPNLYDIEREECLCGKAHRAGNMPIYGCVDLLQALTRRNALHSLSGGAQEMNGVGLAGKFWSSRNRERRSPGFFESCPRLAELGPPLPVEQTIEFVFHSAVAFTNA